jgi:hypothetical protein
MVNAKEFTTDLGSLHSIDSFPEKWYLKYARPDPMSAHLEGCTECAMIKRLFPHHVIRNIPVVESAAPAAPRSLKSLGEEEELEGSPRFPEDEAEEKQFECAPHSLESAPEEKKPQSPLRSLESLVEEEELERKHHPEYMAWWYAELEEGARLHAEKVAKEARKKETREKREEAAARARKEAAKTRHEKDEELRKKKAKKATAEKKKVEAKAENEEAEETEQESAEQPNAKPKPQKRKQEETEETEEFILETWAKTASHKQLLSMLSSGGHAMEDLNGLDIDALRDRVLHPPPAPKTRPLRPKKWKP